MAEFNFDNLAKNLPDCYKKSEQSNNYKILEIERYANTELRDCLNEIDNILDIENAKGSVLDAYGERFGQMRGKATDEQYRMMIKAKIVRSLSRGNYRDIVDALGITFCCGKNDLLIVESSEVPMRVTIEKAPLQQIIKAGLKAEQAKQIIESILPIGVSLESATFNGTFEFGENEGEYSEDAGFGETTDGEIGGYLGWFSSDKYTDYLPI